MSYWMEITDPEDISAPEDVAASLYKKEVHILYGYDRSGNNYISIPIDLLLTRLKELGVIKQEVAEDE